jgi:hypothetical protein
MVRPHAPERPAFTEIIDRLESPYRLDPARPAARHGLPASTGCELLRQYSDRCPLQSSQRCARRRSACDNAVRSGKDAQTLVFMAVVWPRL